jgi:hypothetical protein
LDTVNLRKVHKRRKLLRLLKDEGYYAQGGTKHAKMAHPDDEKKGTKPVTVKRHGDLGRGLRQTMQGQIQANRDKLGKA